MALKRMNITIAEEMHSWLKSESEKRGLTMNALIIFALEQYYREQNVKLQLDKLERLAMLNDE